jgi:hypothetical protein
MVDELKVKRIIQWNCRFLVICTIANTKSKIYRNVILSVVFMGVKLGVTWREKRRLRVFENRVLRRIFGPKKDEGLEKIT